jgi:hypothetical protein
MAHELEVVIARYNDAWNRHDVDAILAMHTEDSVFENHTSGGKGVGKIEIRKILEGIFATFPDLRPGGARRARETGAQELTEGPIIRQTRACSSCPHKARDVKCVVP